MYKVVISSSENLIWNKILKKYVLDVFMIKLMIKLKPVQVFNWVW